MEVAYGVPWSMEGCITEAISRGRPANIFDGVALTMKEAMEANAMLNPEEVSHHCANYLKRWTSRAMELREEEEKLHKRLPDHRRAILKGKRFLVLKEML